MKAKQVQNADISTAAEERFKQLFESSPNGLLLADGSGVITLVNSQAESQFGYTREDLVGLTIDALVPKRIRAMHERHRSDFSEDPLERPMGSGRDLYAVRSDGSEFPVEIGLTPITTNEGQGVLCSVVDITERKKDDDEKDRLLRELDRRNDEISCLYRIGEIIRRRGLETQAYQQVLEVLFQALSHPGIAGCRLTLGGMTFSSRLFAITSASIRYDITPSGRMRGNLEVFLVDNHHADSSMEEQEQLIEAVAKLIEETIEREEAEAKVLHASKLASIGELAAGLGHEINNPINGIINCADIIAKESEEGSKVHKFAGLIRQESNRIAGIARSLLTFSRQDREQYSPASMSDIVDNVLTLCRKRIEKAHIHLEIDIPRDIPELNCKSEQIQQVLMNLIINAVHALEAKFPDADDGKIMKVYARAHPKAQNPFARLTVEDHGTGIESKDQERIFDPFYTTKGRNEGTGLGLSVSDGIVKSHGGTITLETEVGNYTRFHVDLPVDPTKHRLNDALER